jgi:hypothetical protein
LTDCGKAWNSGGGSQLPNSLVEGEGRMDMGRNI